MTEAIAVLDIGMTNKKVVLYSNELALIGEKRKVFLPSMRDGIETHDLKAMEEWFLASLGEFAA
ncbi:MAG TPA: carbohydrate kinase, partial [Rectinema sp.]|nr:carbohydrate kinase [Rectinema sp.]